MQINKNDNAFMSLNLNLFYCIYLQLFEQNYSFKFSTY